jgi:hypothetical protein
VKPVVLPPNPVERFCLTAAWDGVYEVGLAKCRAPSWVTREVTASGHEEDHS